MQENDSHQITHLLADWCRGDQTALDELCLINSRSTYETRRTKRSEFQASLAFSGVAAEAMHHIFVDYAPLKSRHEMTQK